MTKEEVVERWLQEIKAAREREKDFRKNGREVMDIYSGDKSKTVPFNILFSNTDTLMPAYYSSTPRPVVRRRFKDNDPLGMAAARAGERMLTFLVDTNIDGYETFDEGMRSVTLDGLLPGRGVSTVKYDYEEGVYAPPTPEAEPTPNVKSELVCVEHRLWNRVYFGYAKHWSKMPWIAYEDYIDKAEARRLFGSVADKLSYFPHNKEGTADGDSDDTPGGVENKDSNDQGLEKTALIYQIWDKDGGRKVRYISPSYKDDFLRVDDDPLELTGFFNCPRPIQFTRKGDSMVPVAPYELYRNQAEELNTITLRLNRIVRAIKARGAYDGQMGDELKQVMDGDDNVLVPANDSSSVAYEKGLANAIWFLPVDIFITVAEKLVLARNQAKQTIYEITGVSDIIRGSTQASETATAQKIKSEWGTLRLKQSQREVQRYARDMLRLMLEIAASKFDEKTWAMATGLPFATTEAWQAAKAIEMNALAQGMQPDPNTVATLQQPVWGKVLELLRNDMQRAYRVDIETNSTVELEAVEDQKNISEVMSALGQLLNGLTPLVTSGALPFAAAQAMMLAVVRRYRFGEEIEDYIKAMQPPKPPEQDKSGEEAMQKQLMTGQQQNAQLTIENSKLKADLEAASIRLDLGKQAAALDIKKRELDAQEERLKLAESVARDRLDNKANVEQVRRSADDKVRSIKDAAAKREQAFAEQEKATAEQSKATMDTLSKQLTDLQETQTLMAQMMKSLATAVAGPQERTVERDDEGNPTYVVVTPRGKPAGDDEFSRMLFNPRRTRLVRDGNGYLAGGSQE